jgi:hypothetical protein
MDKALEGDHTYSMFLLRSCNHRFSLIITNPYEFNHSDEKRPIMVFSEENDLWVKWMRNPF